MRKILLCFLTILALPSAASAQSVVATLPVAGNPFRIVVTPDGSQAYVLLNNSDIAGNCLMSVLNIATNTVTNPALPGINNCPENISITPNGANAYVAGGGNQLSVISTGTNSAIAEVTVGISQAIATTPNGLYVYVGNSGDGAVSVISTATNSIVATVPVGAIFSPDISTTPGPLSITPNGAYAYVATNTGTVAVISTATNTIVAAIPVNSDVNLSTNDPIAVSPNGAYVYIGNILDNSVSVISTATNTVTATIPIGGAPTAIAVAPDGSHVYVPASNGTAVIDTSTNTITALVPVVAVAVAITPNGAYAYLSGNGGVSVVSTATNSVIATVPLGPLLSDIAIGPDGKYAYVGDYGNSTVSVISMPPIKLGGYLSGNWFMPSQGGGQGFQLEMTDAINSSTGKPIMLAIWFTFTPAGSTANDGSGQNWIYAQGDYDTTTNTVTLPAVLLAGAKFPPNFVAGNVHRVPNDSSLWGNFTFAFTDCNNGTVSWHSDLAGYNKANDTPVAIQRLTKIAGTTCPQ